jgi:N-acetylmuramoyl-L-alanine amidase
MRKITEIIIHSTATPAGKPFTVGDVDAWHRARGFRCIGYHYLIGINGQIWRGRSIEETGAHCLHHNAQSIGICYVGGVEAVGTRKPADTRTPAQKTALVNLLKQLLKQFPEAVIHSHRDFAATNCPSFDATAEYRNLKHQE